MRKVIVLSFMLIPFIGIHASKRNSWSVIDQKIDEVFDCFSKGKKTEILRLYDKGTYEHLFFESKGYNEQVVERNLGKYKIVKNKIIFEKPTQLEFKGQFQSGSYFYKNGKIYPNFWAYFLFKKNYLYKTTSKKEYRKPFFIHLDNDVVVNNFEAEDELDIDLLLSYLLKSLKSDQEKIDVITKFIVQSIEYDHEGLKLDHYANKQNDLKGILVGKQRLAVCAGYSYVFMELCEKSGIKARTVLGHTRQSHNDLKRLTGFHAWNIVDLGEKEMIYDVTWADNGTYIDQKWINVEPEVMIYSHYPLSKDDQLLKASLSQEDFIKAPLILPLCKGAKLPGFKFSSYIFCDKMLTISFLGNHSVEVTKLPSDFQKVIYNGENYTYKTQGSNDKVAVKVNFHNDSTYLTIPLGEEINLFSIDIENCLNVKLIATKGGYQGMMRHYMANADNRYADPYIKGVVAAIRVKDYKKLKELAGFNANVFFDTKGKLKLDKKMLLRIDQWEGEISTLTNLNSFSYDSAANRSETKSSMFIEIPDGPRFILDNKDGIYSVSSIE